MECLETFLVRLVYGMCDSLAKSIILATANSLAPLAKTGRPRVSHELLLDQFIRVLRTGTTWRDVKGIDFRTAHRHFLRWAREGIFEPSHAFRMDPAPFRVPRLLPFQVHEGVHDRATA